ncbi:MAG: FxLYD domain-containing protein [Gemmatimonadota bacterium]
MALHGTKYLAAASLFVSAALGAQAAPAKPSCDVGESAKGNAARATLSVNLAREAASPAVAASNLKNAVKLVETTEKGDDPVVNAYTLGTALSLFANQPGIGLTPTRGAVGFVARPTEKLDIPSTLDSLFKIVETAKPLCADYTAYWRAGQKFYLDVVNGAINAMNADKLDSADYYAKQANTLYPPSPYGNMILGGVMSKRNNEAKAIEYWTLSADLAAKDTSYRDVRRQMLSNIGQAYSNIAMTATGAAKVDAAKKGAASFEQLLAVPGTKGSYVSMSRQQLQTLLLSIGDTAGAAKSWEALIANPSAYEYQDLLNSAVNAARANRSGDAGKLFEATLAQNPYSRDALYNVAVTYLTMEQNEKVGPIVKRLVAVDTGNPENYFLAARAYLSLAKVAEKAKKTPIAAALNDTTLTWYSTGNKLPVEVTFQEFSPNEKDATIAGTVMDRRDKADENEKSNTPAPAPAPAKGAKGKAPAKAAAPAPPPPKTFPPKAVTLTFTGIDKSGAAVGTQTVTTEALAPGQSAKFRFKITGANVVAYKYTIDG